MPGFKNHHVKSNIFVRELSDRKWAKMRLEQNKEEAHHLLSKFLIQKLYEADEKYLLVRLLVNENPKVNGYIGQDQLYQAYNQQIEVARYMLDFGEVYERGYMINVSIEERLERKIKVLQDKLESQYYTLQASKDREELKKLQFRYSHLKSTLKRLEAEVFIAKVMLNHKQSISELAKLLYQRVIEIPVIASFLWHFDKDSVVEHFNDQA